MKNHPSNHFISRQMLFSLLFGSFLLIESAHGGLVYDSGPELSQPNGAFIPGSYSDPFNLSSSTPLGAAQITVYSPSAVTQPVSLFYLIQPSSSSSILSQGRVNLNLTPLGSSGGDSFYSASFPLSGSYNAGNYVLTLSNSVSSGGLLASLFWQFCNNNGSVASLQLYSDSVIPEPAGFPWMAGTVAVVCVGVLARRRQKKHQTGE